MTRRDTAVSSALLRLRHLVTTQFAPGDRLPTEKALADSLDVSRTTVREALGMLAAEGAVTRAWGVGTFVSEPQDVPSLSMTRIQSYRDRVAAGGRQVALVDASCQVVECPPAVRSVLGLAAEDRTWRVRRVFAVDGAPSALMVEHVPEVLFGRPVDPSAMLAIDTDLFEMLDRHEPGAAARTSMDIEAVAADEHDGGALGVAAGTPLLRGTQVTYTRRGEAVAHGIALHRTDRVRMRITR